MRKALNGHKSDISLVAEAMLLASAAEMPDGKKLPNVMSRIRQREGSSVGEGFAL